MKTIGVIGGDRRQAMLAELLEEDGFTVCTYGVPARRESERLLAEVLASDALVLPLPLCWQPGVLNGSGEEIRTEELFAAVGSGRPVLAGQVREEQWEEAARHGVFLRDYFLREEMMVANAAATAEAALGVAMERMDRTLLGTECLVLGFGRIGKLLAFRLHGLGARVTAAARKPADLAWISALGWQAVELGGVEALLHRFPVVFNTVPAPILSEDAAGRLPEDGVVIDLASVRGADETAVSLFGDRWIWARGLPGKMVPRSAAAAIHGAVRSLLEEWEGSV